MTTKTCSEPYCGRPLHGWGAFCGNHAARAYLYGHPGIKAGITESAFRPFALWTSEGIQRYRSTRATQAALVLADGVLNYRNTNGFTYQLRLEGMLQILRDDQVTPEDVLRRTCLFVAFASAHPERFKGSTRAENLAMGRCVMRLAPLQRHGKRYPGRSVGLLGELLRDALYTYSLNLVARLQADAVAHRDAVSATLDLDTPADVPPEAPRAGVIHRKLRGVQ